MMVAVLIEQEIHQTLNWPMAAALSAVLLALTLGVYGVAQSATRQEAR
jgi:ABC-type spermidine/putrescine transport system permease subunit I